MTNNNAEFVGSVPAAYDRYLGPVIFEPYAVDLARRIPIHIGAPVLEVACGTGVLTRHLRARLPSSIKLVATDLNVPMIDHARTKLANPPGVEWRTADASSLPFASGSFGAVACQFGIMFVPDKAAAFNEARRVLVNSGSFVFNVWGRFDQNFFGRIAHETIASFFRDDPPNFYQVPFGFNDPKTISAHLKAAGFSDFSMDEETFDCVAHSPELFARGLIYGNPVGDVIEQRGIEQEQVVERLAAALRSDDGTRRTMTALVITAKA